MKVLITTDGSKCSKLGIDWVTNNSWPAEAEFLVLGVVETPNLDYGIVAIPDEFIQGIGRDLETVVEAESRVILTILHKHSVSHRVEYGHVASQIVETARDWKADLIVIGSHGRKGINHFLMGSVAESVLHLAPCSVLIVKDADGQIAEASKSMSKRQSLPV